MMRILFYLTGLFGLICVSCNQTDRKSDSTSMLVCNAGEISGGTREFLLSELTDAIDVVRLETGDNCLVKNIWKVFVTDSYIGVLEHDMRPYKLFDRKGRFIAQIGAVGQGPQEYTGVISSFIDEAAGRIYLSEFFNANRLLCYDLTGKHIENIPFCYKQLAKPQFFVENGIVTIVQIPVANKEVFLFQQNLKGELIQSIPPSEEMDAWDFNGDIFTSRNGGVFSIHYTAVDTLFHYDAQANRLTPQFNIQFGRDDMYATYREWPNHFFVWTREKPVLIDKHTGKAWYVQAKNDFLGGLETSYFSCDNDYAVVSINAFRIREDLEKAVDRPGLSPEVRARMTELVNNIDDDDNPVLIIGRLK
jgi:hypothetical protein